MNGKKLVTYLLALGALAGIKLYGDKCYTKGVVKGTLFGYSVAKDSEKEKVNEEKEEV